MNQLVPTHLGHVAGARSGRRRSRRMRFLEFFAANIRNPHQTSYESDGERRATQHPEEIDADQNAGEKSQSRQDTIAANSPSAVQAVKRQVSATIADHALTREALEQQSGRGASQPPLRRGRRRVPREAAASL